MFGAIFRIIWRILIFTIGGAVVWLAVFMVYPYAEDRLPAFVVLLLLYCAFAYFVIPTLVRLMHLVVKPDHLPVYALTVDGWSSDPVNIAFVCKNKTQLENVLRKSGWYKADPATLKNTLHQAYAILFNRSYPTAPFSSIYLLGRKQDIGYQVQTGANPSPRHRHHIRLWQLPATDESGHKDEKFWHKIFQIFRRRKLQVWVAAATHDIAPFAFRMQNLQITHQIDSDTNKERDFVIKSIQSAGYVKRVETVTTGEPLTFRGQTFGVNIVVDGQLKVVELKK